MKQDRGNIEYSKIIEYANLNGCKILEVGCGNGRVSVMLARTAKSVIAIDPDSEQINIAKSAVKGVDFRVGSGEDILFNNETFDTVAFTFSLHHQNAVKALREAHRVLKSGGQLLIIEPSGGGEVHRFFKMFRDETLQLANALEAIRDSNFEPVREETFSTEWVFDDCEDLYVYYFNHYKMPRDSEFIKKMNALLGDRVQNRPIALIDRITIFSLRKR
jgi:ubiquinone/menaquinone biosynthesis C-methylase UbiE